MRSPWLSMMMAETALVTAITAGNYTLQAGAAPINPNAPVNPNAPAVNATGTVLRYNNRVRSAAADWSFYPVGTTFRIKGLPYLYVVDDYGSALLGTGTVDIYKPTKEIMAQWGRRNVELTVVQWGSFTRSAELLSQRTSYDHCRKMLANIVRQRPDLGRVAKL